MKNLQVRLPKGLREEADEVLSEIGLDMSSAIRIYLKKIVQSRSIPFSLEAPKPSEAEILEVDPEVQSEMDKAAQIWADRQP